MKIIALLSIIFSVSIQAMHAQDTSHLDALMREYGMVDVQSLDSTILVDLKYSSDDNFVGVDMYGDLERAYLEREFADRVVLAQKSLKKRNPRYTLLIYDAARPISVQRTMHQCVQGTNLEGFVADGTRGGRHNYGVAVDVTIATLDGEPLDMGADFDDFSDVASVKGTPDTSDPATRTMDVYKDYVNSLVSRGLISAECANNRLLLIEVMYDAGLYPYRREWWHYEDIMPMNCVRKEYKLLDF